MLLLQIALLRVFAVQQFYHFAFMVISLALLGIGASGSLLSVRGRRLSPVLLSTAFGVTTLGAYLLINYLPFDSYSIAWDPRQVFYLALYFLAAAAPFLFSGLLIGGELMVAGRKGYSHRVYGANLIGSAMGSIGSLPLLQALGSVGTLVLAGTTGAAAGLFFAAAPEYARRYHYPVMFMLLAPLVLAGLLTALQPPSILQQQLSPYKTLPILSQALDAEHTLTQQDATARVDVVESSTIHIMPGLSLLSPAGPPLQAGLMLDGDNLMPITALSPTSRQAATLAEYIPGGLAYWLRPGGRTLIIEAGTGMDVLFSLAAGAESVTAVEEQELVLEIVREEYADWTDNLYHRPRVTVINQAGRVFARVADPGQYDVVTVALTDPHRPVTSGAYSLTEDYRYTIEAFRDYLRVLDDSGLLVITRWLQTPPSESARLFGTAAQALKDSGREPSEHLLAFRTLRTMTVVASEEAYSTDEIETVREFLRTRAFDAVYYPGIQAKELNHYSVLDEPLYHDLFVRLLDNPVQVYDEYRFDIRPPTDDRPFFFHYFKWRQTPEILAGLGRTWQPFGGSGYFVLVALLILVTLASLLLILGPLIVSTQFRVVAQTDTKAISETPGLSRWQIFAYFACLGLAFLFVELPLAQGFILVLDEPVTALAAVIFAILLFSGLGSLTVQRWSLKWALLALVMVIALYPLILRPFSTLALLAPEPSRIALSVLVIAPLGYLMGLPFAGGLRVVEGYMPALVPWAWAINGSVSVVSAVLAVVLALSWGFTIVLWLGAAAYAGALAAFWSTLGTREGTTV
ncbi:MAG: hypothetical protein M3220_12960 [Chloroflexota bacterium]|nr:hypothetical protein [Chloroflexota bacterium]